MANGNGPRYGDLEFDDFLRPGKSVKAGVFGHTESGFKQWNDQWEVLMKKTLYQFQNNLGMSMQCKADVEAVTGKKTEVTYNEAAAVVRLYEYCYAGYLMAKSKGNHTAQLEHDFTTFRGIATWYSHGINNTPDTTFPVGIELPPMYTYPLGDPAEQISYAAWPETSYRVAAHTFARKFENGLVLINPYDPDGITPLDINAGPQTPGVISGAASNHANDDTFELSHKMIDAATGEVLDRLTVMQGSARFLLYSPSWSGEVAGANQQYVPYYRSMGLDDYGQNFTMPPTMSPTMPPTALDAPKEGEWQNTTLNATVNYTMRYRIFGDEIEIEVAASTSGYIALGFSETAPEITSILGSKAIVGWSKRGVSQVGEYSFNGRRSANIATLTSSFISASASAVDGVVSLSFRRKLVTDNIVIQPGVAQNLIWAIHTRTGIRWPSQHGNVRHVFMAPATTSPT